MQEQDATGLRYAVHTPEVSSSNLSWRKMDRLCFQLQEFGDRGYFEEAAYFLTCRNSVWGAS